MRLFITFLIVTMASQAAAQSNRNYLSNQAAFELVACNPGSEITNVREGPSAKNYKKVAELLNGQSVSVLGRETNPDGYDYYRIVYHVQLGSGRLFEEEGYVYHSALAQSCNVDFGKLVQRHTTWPVEQGTVGCKVALANAKTLDAWNGVSAALMTDRGGVVNIQLPLCRESKSETVHIVDYLGQEAEKSRFHFEVSIDGCKMRYQLQKTPTGMEAGLYHTPACPGDPEGSKKSLMTGVDAAGNLFTFAFEMFVGGVDVISGGALSNAPPEAFIISKETAMETEIRSCESVWTENNMFEDIFGSSPDYTYCVIDYCGQASNGSWFCSAEPVR